MVLRRFHTALTMVLVPVSLQCNLISSPKEPSGVITVVLLQWCRIIARIRYCNMFFYIRKPDGAIGDQPMEFSTVSTISN